MRIGLERGVEREAEAEFTPLAAISANVTGSFPVPVRTLESGVDKGVSRVVDADTEFFLRAAVMIRARWSASRAWAGETTEMQASSESRTVAMERETSALTIASEMTVSAKDEMCLMVLAVVVVWA